METQWQRTEMYEMLRGRNIESRVCILPCEHRSHPCDSLLLVASWGAETKHLWRSDHCFLSRPSHWHCWDACGALWEISQKHSDSTVLMMFVALCSVFSFCQNTLCQLFTWSYLQNTLSSLPFTRSFFQWTLIRT